MTLGFRCSDILTVVTLGFSYGLGEIRAVVTLGP